MKRAFGLFFGMLLFVSVIPHKIVYVFSAEQPEVSAKAAVLISADTGEIVWEHNSGQKLPMASTTKIMTTLLCIESGGLDVPFQVDSAQSWAITVSVTAVRMAAASSPFVL